MDFGEESDAVGWMKDCGCSAWKRLQTLHTGREAQRVDENTLRLVVGKIVDHRIQGGMQLRKRPHLLRVAVRKGLQLGDKAGHEVQQGAAGRSVILEELGEDQEGLLRVSCAHRWCLQSTSNSSLRAAKASHSTGKSASLANKSSALLSIMVVTALRL
jgi:hypothetical protein